MTVQDIAITGLRPVQAIVVGASAGGVEALLAIFADLKPGFRLPIIVVLHMPDERRSQLAAVFDRRLEIPVKEVEDKEPIASGTLYFAAPGYHVSVEHDHSFSIRSRCVPRHPGCDITHGRQSGWCAGVGHSQTAGRPDGRPGP